MLRYPLYYDWLVDPRAVLWLVKLSQTECNSLKRDVWIVSLTQNSDAGWEIFLCFVLT